MLVSLSENFSLVLLNVSDVFLTNRNVVLQVEVVIYSAEWQCLLFFQECKTLEELAFILVLAEGVERLKECL